MLGVEGRQAAFQAKGIFAVLIGVLMLGLGVSVMFDPDLLYSMFGLCEGSCEKTLR